MVWYGMGDTYLLSGGREVELRCGCGSAVRVQPLGGERGAQQAVVRLGQRGVPVAVEVREAALRCLQDLHRPHARPDGYRRCHRGAAEGLLLGQGHVRPVLLRPHSLERVVVGGWPTGRVYARQALPDVLQDFDVDALNYLRVFF